MSQQQQAGHSIVDIYKGVINDVISQVKEAFLDENIDIDVLQQLKKDWEEKLIASGSVDWEGPKHVAPPQIRHTKPAVLATSVPAGLTVRLAQNGQTSGAPQIGQTTVVTQATSVPHGIHRSLPQVQYVPIAADQQLVIQRPQISSNAQLSAIPSNMITFQTGSGPTRIVQSGQQYIMHTSGGATNIPAGSSVMILNTGTQQIPVNLNSATVFQSSSIPVQSTSQAKKESPLPMLDGSISILTEERRQFGSSKQRPLNKSSKSSSRAQGNAKCLIQLDGATRISDSSSEEDDIDEDDDDDPLRRIADRIGEDGNNIEDEEQVVEEDPLNSEDDQSDDEDVEKLFEAENLVMCQFEKVHRTRSKWKFTLKDGIMHIRGKDHCFQRCSGEAEW